jgi:hypothetical protein
MLQLDATHVLDAIALLSNWIPSGEVAAWDMRDPEAGFHSAHEAARTHELGCEESRLTGSAASGDLSVQTAKAPISDCPLRQAEIGAFGLLLFCCCVC